MKRRYYLTISIIVICLFSLSGCDAIINGENPLKREYTLTVKIEGEGVVTPSVGTHYFQKDEIIVVRAESASLWVWAFKEWKGDVSSKRQEVEIVMDRDKTITAVFTETVEFEDTHLEEVVREAIGIFEGVIYLDEVRDLYELVASNRDIESLEGIQYLRNLRMLNIRSNQIQDLSPLEGLTRLESLSFWDNQVDSISPLKNLISLRSLSFWNNNVRDLTPLRECISLERLIFENNQVVSLAGLEKLTNLQWLWFDNNQVRDIKLLENLTDLSLLYFPNNEVEDISPLVNNPSFGNGDEIDMRQNYLDLTPDSQSMKDIQTLLDRGVGVEYEPQKEK